MQVHLAAGLHSQSLGVLDAAVGVDADESGNKRMFNEEKCRRLMFVSLKVEAEEEFNQVRGKPCPAGKQT